MAKLLFCQTMDYEFVGPMYIASAVKARGHTCRLAGGQSLRDFEGVLESYRPDLVGFSVMTGSHRWGQRLAGQIKARYGIGNVFGGPHATFFPEFVLEPEVDAIVRGEGEEAVADILDRIDAGEAWDDVANVCAARDGTIAESPLRPLCDPDAVPMPDRHLYDPIAKRLDRNVRAVITSRGCPYHCTFCFEDAMRELYRGKGKHVRIRGVENVIEECAQLKRDTNVRVIYFADDVFGIDRRWLAGFLDAYRREIGLPFICLLRADIVASDDDYARRLAEAGCRSAFFGIETGNERLRNEVLRKSLTDEQIVRAAERLREAGIRFRTYNILGLPGETLVDAWSTVDLNVRIRTDYPWCSIFSPYPGTALADYAIRHGYLHEGFDCNELSQSFFLGSKLDLPDVRQIENLQKFFQTLVLWPSTRPIVQRLIRLRPNRWFEAWFGLVYFITFIRSERRGFWGTLRFALRNFHHVLARR